MIIEIRLKGGAYLPDPLHIPDPCAVPRVGEYIDTPPVLLEQVQRIPQLLTVDVRYRLDPRHGWQAVVTAMARDESPQTRAMELAEGGWLGQHALP